ncbi:hypothetical protein KSD_34280 [Ktedonobacter sp. SOSP1-85]|uniref:hypothetical protein n=1 Tax=Ktedonobacter sp. SOSP1-85 TaxID=2778367 RepID=UPI00191666C1|nr:hypothetical protein [Ktedonobacter sp. SOSP1-85]GHO75657.1 hypothetical protein KSD_34280 [Ktedonobacter sp. SOSP1-85]
MSQQMYPQDDEYRGYQSKAYTERPEGQPQSSQTYQPPSYDMGAQKIGQVNFASREVSPGQRLALGIVSVVMFVPISAIFLSIGDSSNPISIIARLIGFGIVSLAIIIINVAFNWHRS